MKVIVTKSYSRKVDLKEITSKYQMIDLGTNITLTINVKNEKELNNALKAVGKKVLSDTERDIAEALVEIKKIAQSSEDDALVGDGINVSKKSLQSSKIDGMDEILSSRKGEKNGD